MVGVCVAGVRFPRDAGRSDSKSDRSHERRPDIPSSTYHRWRHAEREPCERRRQDAELTDRIRQDSGGIYGSPRVHAILRREGIQVGRKRVERLMRQAGLAGISPRKGKGFTRRDPDADLAPDLVQRDFTAPAPNRLWVTDLIRRIQKRLGYLSPIEFEEKHYADQATAEPVNLKPRQPALTS
ncbi:IS3 family transposase [Streptomyces sp. NPDC005962]|uniref:IS3 family transposase n=1 Tax=Streptomyces sp. NPDC005962 TaxID=3154466 RepID=UPI003411CBD5